TRRVAAGDNRLTVRGRCRLQGQRTVEDTRGGWGVCTLMPSRAMPRTIVALVENKPGVLNRIASKWRQRGFNIESLAVGHSEKPGISRMTFTVDGATNDVDQVTKQLFKVIEVVEISDITQSDVVARELALIRVAASANNRTAILEIAQVFRAQVI